MRMALEIGTEMAFDGAVGEVVAVTATTDEDGRGAIAYGGAVFRFRALKAFFPAEPLVATNDPDFRVGLLRRQHAEPGLFCLVADDLPAPGWGRWIQQDCWREAHELSGEDAVVFVLGWRPGTLTVKRGGEVEAGVFVDMTLDYETSQGPHRAWWQPAYPYNDLQVNIHGVPLRGPNRLGRLKTDPEGQVHLCAPDGTLEPVIVPRGIGALGNRAQDRWPGGPEPERVLTELRLWYLQESVEVREGEAVTLDVAAVQIAVRGIPFATCQLLWEGGIARGGCTLNADGEGVITNLPPGRYTAAQYHPTDKSKGTARASVEALQSGGEYEINLPTAWTTVADGYIQGIVYGPADAGAAGAIIYGWWPGFPGYAEPIATCDGNGAYGPVEIPVWSGDSFFAHHPDWGAVGCFDSRPTKALWFDPQLAAPFGAVASAGNEMFPEGLCPWGTAGRHVNLLPHERPAYMLDETTQRKYWFRPGSGEAGLVTDACPRGAWTPPNGFGTWTLKTYSLCEADGTALQSGLSLPGSTLPPWTDDLHEYDQTTLGQTLSAGLGGKVEGNAVEAARHAPITGANLTEASRMGLEFGRRRQPLEARLAVPSLSPLTCYLTFQSLECPYCGGPAWTDPDRDGYRRGFCMQCADFGVTTDARTYFITPALPPADDWGLRWVRASTAGGYSDRLIQGWPRPEEYAEADEYLVEDWLGLIIPRWVAAHLVLAAWNAGVFVEGESIAEAEARLGRTVGPVMLKLELTADYAGLGQTLRVAATRPDGGTAWRVVHVAAGSRAGDRFPLHWHPHHQYPQGYYTEVTAIERVSGDGAVWAQVVNDGPAWHSAVGVCVAHQVHSPYACDVVLAQRDPHLVEDFAGRLHLVYLREGQVLHRTLEGTVAAWSAPLNVSLQAGWSHPCTDPSLALLPHAELVVSAYTRGATRLWRTATA
jgi:hypothetical protein